MGNFPSENIYFKKINGRLTHKNSEEYSKRYDHSKYQFFLEAPFEVSNRCCDVMKKKPFHDYVKQTGKVPLIATMADESELRKSLWIKYGCNGFAMSNPRSTPMAFWTEQDVLQYIKENNLPICSVYGDIVYQDSDGNQYENSLDNRMKLTTTGCKRTGCMFCGYGCHLNSDDRFVRMKETHPKQYNYIFKPKSEGGLGYKEVIDWINEHGNLNIRY